MLQTLTPAHLPALLALDAATNPHPWSAASWASSLAGHLCLGWFEQDELQGFCIVLLLPDEAELLLIAVSPEYQRRGIARRLLDELQQRLAADNIERLFLEVRTGNVAARRLYEGCGFIQNGLRKGYYPTANGREDAAIYTFDCISSGAATA